LPGFSFLKIAHLALNNNQSLSLISLALNNNQSLSLISLGIQAKKFLLLNSFSPNTISITADNAPASFIYV
jgi:hypothetical protein